MVPKTDAIIPGSPKTFQPTIIATLTAIAPGADCASAIRSSISDSLIHPSSSENFFFTKVAITNPPPKVNALI